MKLALFLLLSIFVFQSCVRETDTTPLSPILQFVYVSDAHYGITRESFHGSNDVDAAIVNAFLISKVNTLPTAIMPNDAGVNAGAAVGAIDMLINTGDYCTRAQDVTKSAASSWASFETQYINGITLRKRNGAAADVFYTIGNHDVSNAIGHTKPLTAIDPVAMVNTYNNMVRPTTAITASTFDYTIHKIRFTRESDGVMFVFANMWPDPSERAWIEAQLKNKPALLFVHDEAAIEAKQLMSPNGPNDFSNKFENLVNIVGTSPSTSTINEQKGFAAWLKTHTQLKAYFHGNSNYNEFYDFTVDGVSLPVFRVDSPMKGEVSSKNPQMLSFQLVSIDTRDGRMTVREVLYNHTDLATDTSIKWGATRTVKIF